MCDENLCITVMIHISVHTNVGEICSSNQLERGHVCVGTNIFPTVRQHSWCNSSVNGHVPISRTKVHTRINIACILSGKKCWMIKNPIKSWLVYVTWNAGSSSCVCSTAPLPPSYTPNLEVQMMHIPTWQGVVGGGRMCHNDQWQSHFQFGPSTLEEGYKGDYRCISIWLMT